MTQAELFWILLVSLVLVINGIIEIKRRHYGMGALMIGIPVCGWISILVKGTI